MRLTGSMLQRFTTTARPAVRVSSLKSAVGLSSALPVGRCGRRPRSPRGGPRTTVPRRLHLTDLTGQVYPLLLACCLRDLATTDKTWRGTGVAGAEATSPSTTAGTRCPTVCTFCSHFTHWWQSSRHEDSPRKWRRCDVSRAYDLCVICARGTAGGTLRWAWIRCDNCRAVNESLISTFGYRPFALGRHSLMNGERSLGRGTGTPDRPSGGVPPPSRHSVGLAPERIHPIGSGIRPRSGRSTQDMARALAIKPAGLP